MSRFSLAYLEGSIFTEPNLGGDARRTVVNIYRRSVFQGVANGLVAVDARQLFHMNNQSRSWDALTRKRHHVAAVDLIDAEIRYIDGRAHSRLRNFQFVAVALNRTNTRFEIGRVNNDLLAAAQRSAG